MGNERKLLEGVKTHSVGKFLIDLNQVQNRTSRKALKCSDGGRGGRVPTRCTRCYCLSVYAHLPVINSTVIRYKYIVQINIQVHPPHSKQKGRRISWSGTIAGAKDEKNAILVLHWIANSSVSLHSCYNLVLNRVFDFHSIMIYNTAVKTRMKVLYAYIDDAWSYWKMLRRRLSSSKRLIL